MNPPIAVLTGPAGSGKTAACAKRFAEAGGRARIAVPTAVHAEHVRSLAAAHGCTNTRGVLSFGELVRGLAGVEDARIVTPAFGRLALTAVFRDEIAPDGYFGLMHRVRGFPNALCEMIEELRLSSITPETLEQAATAAAPAIADPRFRNKAVEAARLYRAYDGFLAARDSIDEQSLPAIAVKHLSDAHEPPFAALFVDGFHRLSRAWREMLAALARLGTEITVTLTLERERPLLFAASLRTLESLRNEFDVQETALGCTQTGKPATLGTLERRLFRSPSGTHASDRSEECGPTSLTDRDPTPQLVLFDTPNPYVEVEMVARALAREHREHGVEWDRCAILLRSPDEYAQTLSSVFERYGIPLSLTGTRPLSEVPAVKPLIALLRVFCFGWRREDMIAFLKSSYVGGWKLEAERLLHRARRAGVRAGREGWAALCRQEEEHGSPLAGPLARILEWGLRLESIRSHAGVHAAALGALAADFGLHRTERPGSDDGAPIHSALAVAADLGRVMDATSAGVLSFEAFAVDLLSAWRLASFVEGPHPGSVVVLEPYDARQQDVEVAVVMGLVERTFPRRVIDDPFFRDDERAALSATGLVALESRRERADDERLLFYLSVTAPSRRLILSFPRSSGEADTLPSFYLDDVRAAVGAFRAEVRTLADIAPRPEECACERDRLLADLATERPDAQDLRTRAIRQTASLPPLPRILDTSLRAAYAAPRRYRVTEIEEYSRCAFQHFMRYGLGVSADGAGGGPADRGTLYHAVLSRCYRRRRRSTDFALREDLLNELAEILRSRAIDAPPYRLRILERYLVEALEGFARREDVLGPRFGLTPAHFELAFGMDATEADTDAARVSREYDESSTSSPLVIQQGGAPPISICGVIDRVDLWPDGARALAIDYKTGETPSFGQMHAGRSLQMPLYLMALEQLWGKIGAGGCHDSPRESGRRRFFRIEHADIKQFGMVPEVEQGKDMVKPVTHDEHAETMQAAVDAVLRAVEGISAADIRPTPGDHCRTCDYADCCRTGADFRHDGEAHDIMAEEQPAAAGQGSESTPPATPSPVGTAPERGKMTP